MRVFITGGTGLVGRRLVIDRLERGDDVIILSRNKDRATHLFAAAANPHVTIVEGDAMEPGPWQDAIDGCDAVIHLAGAGLADKRWTPEYKTLLRDSRIESTGRVVEAIAKAEQPPNVFVCASAIGFYGDTGAEAITEGAPGGADFLATLCADWETAALSADDLTRVVMTRFGLILDDRGGTLEKIMTPMKFFIGGPLGSGRQYMSWVHWRDVIDLINHALTHDDVRGPINVTAPNPEMNKVFTRTLGQVMGRPSWAPVPKFMLRLVMGEFGGFVTASQRVLPQYAQQTGYQFHYPQLKPALEALLNVSIPPASNEARAVSSAARATDGTRGDGSAIVTHPVAAAPPAPVRMIVIDVDGTLLRSDGSLATATVEAIRAAGRCDVAIVLASARPPRAMGAITRALDLNTPLICFNGALIWDAANQHPLHHQALEPEIIRAIIADARALHPQVVIALELIDRWFTDQLDDAYSTEAIWLTDPDGIGPLEDLLREPVTKLNFVGQPSAMSDLAAMIQQRYWSKKTVSLFLSDPRLIQIMHPLVDKGIALQRIARHLEIPRESIMVIGDAPNDLGMMEWAGFAAAVDNAPLAVRKAANVTVPSNNENGVAKAIQRYALS